MIVVEAHKSLYALPLRIVVQRGWFAVFIFALTTHQTQRRLSVEVVNRVFTWEQSFSTFSESLELLYRLCFFTCNRKVTGPCPPWNVLFLSRAILAIDITARILSSPQQQLCIFFKKASTSLLGTLHGNDYNQYYHYGAYGTPEAPDRMSLDRNGVQSS